MSDKAYCGQCGSANPASNRFCGKCGAPLNSLQENNQAKPAMRTSPTNPISSLEELKRLMQEGEEIQVDQDGQLNIPDEEEIEQQLLQGKRVSTVKPQRWFAGVPIRSFRDIQLIEAILNHSSVIYHHHLLFAVFLYTAEDKHLASYVRKNVQELHKMSGLDCLFFIIEQPVGAWDVSLYKDLEGLAGKYFKSLWKRLGTDNFKPFDKTRAYKIGKHFSVAPKQFPCVVFFSNLKAKEVLVVEINDYIEINSEDIDMEYTKFFRVLFSVTQQIGTEGRAKRLSRIAKVLPREWKKTTKKHVKPIESTELVKPIIETIGAIVKVFF